jgi:hypothetical protein
MLWFRFGLLVCSVVLVLGLLADIALNALAKITGGVTVYWRSPFLLLVPLTLWWLCSLAIAWPLAGRFHVRPFNF